MNTMSSHMSHFYIGQTSSMARTFTEKDVRNCLELTREDNTVYFNDTFMQTANLKGKVIPGILSEGLIMEVSSKKLPGITRPAIAKRSRFSSSCLYWRYDYRECRGH